MKFIKGLIWWIVAVTFSAIVISLGLTAASEMYGFIPNSRNVLLASLSTGTLIWWALPRVRSWCRWQRGFPIKPFLSALAIAIISGATDACAAGIHDVLIPPDATPIIQRSLVAGSENWVWVLLIAAGIGLFYWGLVRFLQGCSWYNRPRCNGQ